jgi:hypothetical protein
MLNNIPLQIVTALTQIQVQPTRGSNILDLCFTNRPGLVKHCQTVPGIGDHDIVVVDSDVKAKINKSKSRRVCRFKDVNWDDIKKDASMLNDKLLHEFSESGLDNSWEHFKVGLKEIMDKYIPSKMSSSRYNLPWLNRKLKAMTRKKQKLYNKARKSKSPKDWEKFKSYKKQTQQSIKAAHTEFVSNILEKSLEDKNPKPFWKYVKELRKDNAGVAPLKPKGSSNLITDSKGKAEALNAQFKSVFTKSNYSETLRFTGEKAPSIGELYIQVDGVRKLLADLNPIKASGPDAIPNRMLRGVANEVAPFMTHLFNHSLQSGELPKDWTKAYVTPIFKKNNRHDPANYRPVSLTVVSCKLLEHIVCKHILTHLQSHGLLTDLQHGFRSGHSCETQLLITLHDIMQMYDSKSKKQVDIIILDFSKAFDTVPHDRLLHKLDYLGINGRLNNWIRAFLTNRSQQVVVEGETSRPVSVDSGVPQGSVLGPLLFLCHINDLPDCVTSQVRMFADDCLLYRPINTEEDHVKLQSDLKALEEWSAMWGMSFNPIKCFVMRAGRSRAKSDRLYTLCDHPLELVETNPYLGVLLSKNLKWGPHIAQVTKKANKTLAFLRRNLKTCPPTLKETAYKSLVRAVLDYASTVWDPHFQKDVQALESVQRRAARFVSGDYHRTSSVTDMMNSLGWESLETRRREARLALMYKIIHGLVAVPCEKYIRINISQTRHSSKSYSLYSYAPNSDVFKYSFFPRTVLDWNNLDDLAKQSPTLEEFRLNVKSPLMD